MGDYIHARYSGARAQHYAMIIRRPVRFKGTPEEVAANRATHAFDYSDEDVRCFYCDCRPSHRAASYPCGTRPPYETVKLPEVPPLSLNGVTVEDFKRGVLER